MMIILLWNKVKMLSSFEYELVNKEYIRCLNLINVYSKRGQQCIIFKLRSFECMINKDLYHKVMNGLIKQLQNDNYEVYTSNSEILIFWDKRFDKKDDIIEHHNNISVNTSHSKRKKKKEDENITIDHVKINFGDFEDSLPIKTGNY